MVITKRQPSKKARLPLIGGVNLRIKKRRPVLVAKRSKVIAGAMAALSLVAPKLSNVPIQKIGPAAARLRTFKGPQNNPVEYRNRRRTL